MKKTEFVTFRTDAGTKQSLGEIADKKKWTISLLVEEIIKEWLGKGEKIKHTNTNGETEIYADNQTR